MMEVMKNTTIFYLFFRIKIIIPHWGIKSLRKGKKGLII